MSIATDTTEDENVGLVYEAAPGLIFVVMTVPTLRGWHQQGRYPSGSVEMTARLWVQKPIFVSPSNASRA